MIITAALLDKTDQYTLSFAWHIVPWLHSQKKTKLSSRNSPESFMSCISATLRAKNIQPWSPLQPPASLSVAVEGGDLLLLQYKKRKVYLSRRCYHGFYLNNRPGLQAIYQTLGFGTILGTNLEAWHDKHERNVQRTRMFFGLSNKFSLFTMFWAVSQVLGVDCYQTRLYCWFILLTIIKQKGDTERPNWQIQSQEIQLRLWLCRPHQCLD